MGAHRPVVLLVARSPLLFTHRITCSARPFLAPLERHRPEASL
jgi:hypothetical protein